MINKFLLMISIITFAYAHGTGSHSHGKRMGPRMCEIKGVILDSTTVNPIEYVSISLLNEKNELITGTITDQYGYFSIRELEPGKYSLKIEFMGFELLVVPNIILNMIENRSFDTGKLKLKQSVLHLEAVQVIDKKPIFEFETDKMIYNSSDDIVAGSGTAEDVLNKVPMVTVDSEGEVSLRGNPNVKILINGRPNRTGGEVDNIPASLIEKVEVITSPSAKYDPEGMAGIINIVLKKGRFEGLNGSLKFNGKHNNNNSIDDMNGTTFYSNYQTDKYNLYSSLSLNNRGKSRTSFREVYNDGCPNECFWFEEDGKYYDFDGYRYNSNTDGKGISTSLKVGSDFSVHEKLNINGEIAFKKNKKTQSTAQYYYQDGILSEDYLKKTEEGDYNGNYHIEGYFELIQSYENPDKELSFSVSNHYSIDNEFERLDTLLTSIDENENNYEIDFNYKIPLNDKIKFEFGYDGRFLNTTEIMDFELSDLYAKNDYGMRRFINGIFAELQYELNEKFSIKPSFRVEHVDKKINFETHDAVILSEEQGISSNYAIILQENIGKNIYDKSETNIFPDLHLTYNLTEKKSIQFGISKRIERPGGGSHGSWGQLRPFPRNVYNESFIFVGDPFLEPEFSTQYELSYKSPIPMGFFYTNLFYRNITNSIEWYDYDGQNDDLPGNVVTFVNAEGGNDLGVELFMMVMGQTIGGGYNINELKDSSNDEQLNGKNERLNMYMRMNLPEEYIKFFGFEFGFYYMKLKVPGGTLFGDKGTIWANTGISKSFLEDKFNISFSVNNLFDQGGFQMFKSLSIKDSDENYYYDGNSGNKILQYTDVSATRGGRTFSISMKYNFGEMQKEKQRGRGEGFGGNSMDMGY